ncbi:type II methionyl aminopeptidase [Candidatus Micrarchaeota archaeon]|nr:type II methionyl aminopeptidase [Candidatus Micrarchaeota archaeon]
MTEEEEEPQDEEVDELKNYVEAARVAASVREIAQDLVKPGVTLLSVAEALEAEIIAAKAKPAFPINISLNEAAAHYTPKTGDEKVFGEKDLVKVDVGVHVNGFINDSAISIDLSGENAKLVEASERALENAISVMRAGKSVRDVGAEIQKTIESFGFKPIENLCGHSLDAFMIHAGVEIPNVPRGNHVLEEGDVFAVEPFATTGAGRVEDGSFCEIFSVVNPKNVRLPQSRKLLELVLDDYSTLPFAKRWLAKKMSFPSVELALNDLTRQEVIRDYPILVEVNGALGALVSQAEATVLVEKDSVRMLG